MGSEIYPFEIHLTVTPSIADQNSDIARFQEVCNYLNIKPIILDLELQTGKIQKDVMISAKCEGTDALAFTEAERIAQDLSDRGYQILRTKIETVPWHHFAWKKCQGPIPTNRSPGWYFEAHIAIILQPNHIPLLRECVDIFSDDPNYIVHVSSNIFSKHDDGTVTIMLTYRTATLCREDFEYNVMYITSRLGIESAPWKVAKVIKEFSVYDTNVSHDAEWVRRS